MRSDRHVRLFGCLHGQASGPGYLVRKVAGALAQSAASALLPLGNH